MSTRLRSYKGKLTASRELDAAVAVYAGWKWRQISASMRLLERGFMCGATDDDGSVSFHPALPQYSRDMGAAWEIVERLEHFDTYREKPWWSVTICYGQRNQVGCRIYACSPGQSIFDIDDVIAEDVASTAPEAICRVALAAWWQP